VRVYCWVRRQDGKLFWWDGALFGPERRRIDVSVEEALDVIQLFRGCFDKWGYGLVEVPHPPREGLDYTPKPEPAPPLPDLKAKPALTRRSRRPEPEEEREVYHCTILDRPVLYECGCGTLTDSPIGCYNCRKGGILWKTSGGG
jgi:hypothetical protein